MTTETAATAAAVHRITRRKAKPGAGDEVLEVIDASGPMALDLEPLRSDWSSPSRLHIPRIRDDDDPSGTAAAFVVLAGIAAALAGVAALVWRAL